MIMQKSKKGGSPLGNLFYLFYMTQKRIYDRAMWYMFHFIVARGFDTWIPDEIINCRKNKNINSRV